VKQVLQHVARAKARECDHDERTEHSKPVPVSSQWTAEALSIFNSIAGPAGSSVTLDFKLHAPRKTVVEGSYDGARKLLNFTVLPKERRVDVVFAGCVKSVDA
jgi:hypothetical protein